MSTAEVSQVRFENLAEAEKPYVYSYNIRVPGYAQRTGSRLIFQPGFFERGITPAFASNETRRYHIYFPYPWSEKDSVSIDLPAGFRLDDVESPAPFGAGKDCVYTPKLSITKDQRTLLFERAFSLGGGGVILFDKERYAVVKDIFNSLHEADNHTVSLKRIQGGAK